LLEAMLGLGLANAAYGSMDLTAWQAYETVEEAWIRDRHQLLVQHTPAAVSAARVDLELKLADLNRRAIQFRHLLSCNPGLLRGGVWQMTSLPVSEPENAEMASKMPDYRTETERIRQMMDSLRSHPQYETLRRAQIRLWKTPQYREIHRKYMGRMQELQQLYGGADPPAPSASN
jgi:hypothetical protein